MAKLSFNDSNHNLDPSFQRFALIQQIDYLLTVPVDAELDPDSYMGSTSISYDFRSITQEYIEKDRYLLWKRVANLFAFWVLMSGDQFFRKIRETV